MKRIIFKLFALTVLITGASVLQVNSEKLNTPSSCNQKTCRADCRLSGCAIGICADGVCRCTGCP